MNDIEKKIIEIMGDELGAVSLIVLNEFIEKCSLSDFEKLKELDYDLSQSNDDNCECIGTVMIQRDHETDLPYCFECKKLIIE